MIWLLRHGAAEDGSPDAERPLTAEGERQATDAGRALALLGVAIEACLCSPKVRALDTARLACQALALEAVTESRLEGGPFDAVELAGGFEEVLLVAHEPDLSTAVRDLTGAQIHLRTGGLAGMYGSELSVLLRPSEVSAIAS